MKSVILLLVAFVTIGLLADRLKGYTYLLMTLDIMAYVAYAYHFGAGV